MSLPASDAFTGTNGTLLSTYSANWTAVNGNLAIQSNGAESTVNGGSTSLATWNADTFNNNQYCQVVLQNAAGTAGQIGPGTRAATGARTYYGYEVSSAGREWFKMVAGSYTGLGSNTSVNTAANGDVVRGEAEGSTIRAIYNTVNDSGIGSPVTDSSIASGKGSIGGWDDSGALGTAVQAASWEAGDISAGGGAVIPVFTRQYRQRRM